MGSVRMAAALAVGLLAGCQAANTPAPMALEPRGSVKVEAVTGPPRVPRVLTPDALDAMLKRGISAHLELKSGQCVAVAYSDGWRCSIELEDSKSHLYQLVREKGAERTTQTIFMPDGVLEEWLAQKLGAVLLPDGNMRMGIGPDAAGGNAAITER
jgi:hypothetical protein